MSFAKLKALSIFATQSEGWAHTGGGEEHEEEEPLTGAADAAEAGRARGRQVLVLLSARLKPFFIRPHDEKLEIVFPSAPESVLGRWMRPMRAWEQNVQKNG